MNDNSSEEIVPVDGEQPALDAHRPGLALEVIELDLANQGPPVFDVEVTAPAIAKHVYAVVKRPEIQLAGQPPNGKLFPRVVFEVYPNEEKMKLRLCLIQPGDSIPYDVLLRGCTYLGCFIHPMNSMPIGVYQLEVPPPLEDALIDPASLATNEPETDQPTP